MATLLAVYREPRKVAAVTSALSEAGVPEDEVVVGSVDDEQASKLAEMDAEVAESWGSPGLGAFMTSEMMRGAAVFTLVGAVIGSVVGIPIGLLLFPSDLWVELAVGAGVGFLFGSLVGTLLGGGFAMQSPEEPLAAEVGTTVRVTSETEGVEAVLARFAPVRLDRFRDGHRVETPVTEGPSGFRESVDQFRRNTAEPRRQG